MSIDLFALNHLGNSIADYIDATGPCWLWTGGDDGKGYGKKSFRGKMVRAHRLVYEALVGPIPDGMQLDHLCRVRGCVNPDHLEIVDHAENMRRSVARELNKPHCKHGHAFTVENTYVWRGERKCRTCRASRGVICRKVEP